MRAVAFVAAMLAAQGVSGAQPGQAGRTGPPSRNAVAVIPFANITGVAADDWIGAGIAETITSDLRMIDGLAIIGRESIFDALRGRDAGDPQEPDGRIALDIGRRIGATWVISGGYQHANGVIRITARLIEVATGIVVRSVKIDGAREDIFGAQDRVTVELRGGLSAALAASPGPGRGRGEPATAPAQITGGAPLVREAEGSDVAVLINPGHPAASPPAASSAGPAASAPAPGAVPSASQAPSEKASFPDMDGPPLPVAPEVITRDDNGRATIRAVRIDEPLGLDGNLDEEIYQRVPVIGGFIQQEPQAGAPATEQTEVWVFFDDTTLYVAARCWDSRPERQVVNELRRDSMNLSFNENFVVILDPFHDRRNGFYFQTSPLGAVRELLFTDEGNPNQDWNTVWFVKSGTFDGGWTVEMAIPFKSLRYRRSGPQVWGINFRRIVMWKNEISYLTRVPREYGYMGTFRLSVAGTLVGLETPRQSRNIEVKPYIVTSLTTDRAAAIPTTNQVAKNVGFDFKYGLTRGLIADATYNTDFAQVEEDVQQVNLTRFSLFFPEKREFFLEGQGTYMFGGSQARFRRSTADVPILFFSRQIGLKGGQSVPVVAGGRLTGKVGRWGIGVLNIETDDKPSAAAVRTNFTAVRIKRDILRRSNFGIIATRRAPSSGGVGSNLVVGGDANLVFFRNVSLNSYFAKTQTDGLRDDDTSYRTRFDYAGDRYGFAVEELVLGRNFNPEVGFVRRHDFARTFVQARFSPRPKHSLRVRKYTWEGSFDYVTNAHRTRIENREARGTFRTEFQNSDRWQVDYTRAFELLPQGFMIAPGVVVPQGGYTYQDVKTTYTLGQQHRISGRVAVAHGTLYGGTKTEASYRGRGIVRPRFALEPIVSLNWVDLPYGAFSAQLVSTRVILTPTPRMSVSSLLQFDASAHTLNSSIRLRWEYTGGSELFVVYSDGRNTLARGARELLNRSFTVKLTRLVRF